MNLSAPQTFRSKEISKSNVVDDMVASNAILYEPGEHPDHVVVIKVCHRPEPCCFGLAHSVVANIFRVVLLILKYVPYVGDSKRAMDEYTSEIFMGGKSTIVLHNTCEDSLLAAPIILDLVLLAELSTRIQLKAEGEVCLLLQSLWNHSCSVLLLIHKVFNFAGQVPFLPPSCHRPQLSH